MDLGRDVLFFDGFKLGKISMGVCLETPVAFIIFNRRDTTEKVFSEIAKAKPPKAFCHC